MKCAVHLLAVLGLTLGCGMTVCPPAHATPAKPRPQARRPHPHRPPPRPHPHRKPWPVTISVQTVPALAGVRLTVDGTALTTDSRGVATFTRTHNFDKHTLTLLDPDIDQARLHYRFVRWAGQRDPQQAFSTVVTGLPQRANYTVTAAFKVQYPVTFHYRGQDGTPMILSRISSATAKSDDGRTLQLPLYGRIWLDGKVPRYRKSMLSIADVTYSLQSVTMDGANVVDAGKQRFRPEAAADVTFTGYFHDLTVTSHDALFGFDSGHQVVLTSPDGRPLTVPFGKGHEARLVRLPRGEYQVSVSGGGIVLDQRLRLSRSKNVNVQVISAVDLAVLGAAGALVALILLLAGNGRWRRTGTAVHRLVGTLREAARLRGAKA